MERKKERKLCNVEYNESLEIINLLFIILFASVFKDLESRHELDEESTSSEFEDSEDLRW